MNVRIEEVSSIAKKLHIEVAAEKVDQEIERAFRKIGKSAKIKGFRPGKVPLTVLEKYYAGEMEREVLGRLINDTYFRALDDHAIPAVGEPRIVDSSGVSRGQAFTYQAEIEIKPEVTARDYTGIALQKEAFAVEPGVVDGRLEELRASRAQLEVSPRSQARTGDSVVIDFEGFVDGQPFDGGQAEDFVLELGSGSLIPGFEEQVAGMERGTQREIAVSFPADYGQPTLAGKPATFRVALKEIKEKVVPALDDEFAKGFGVDTLAALRAELETSYRSQETSRIDGELRERLVIIPTQFMATTLTTPTTGMLRRYTALQFEVYHAPFTATDFIAPSIWAVTAISSTDGLDFVVWLDDVAEDGDTTAGVVRVVMLYQLDEETTWRKVELTYQPNPNGVGRAVGRVAPITGRISYFAQAVDQTGNVALALHHGADFTEVDILERPNPTIYLPLVMRNY